MTNAGGKFSKCRHLFRLNQLGLRFANFFCFFGYLNLKFFPFGLQYFLSSFYTSQYEPNAIPSTEAGLDPLSWTPNPLGDRSPRCQSRETDTRPNSGAKW